MHASSSSTTKQNKNLLRKRQQRPSSRCLIQTSKQIAITRSKQQNNEQQFAD
ncbi:hypothetical protein Hanom_Chr17g01578731 [Helianthus anomalus]